MLARYRGYALEINTAIETPMMLLAFLAPRFLFCFLPADMTLPAYLYGAAIAAVAATSASAIASGDETARRVAARGVVAYHIMIMVVAFLCLFSGARLVLPSPYDTFEWRVAQVAAVCGAHIPLSYLLLSYSFYGDYVPKGKRS